MKSKGYIFTIDALFSMVLITTVAYAFTMFAMLPEQNARITQLQALARDGARIGAAGADTANLKALLGIGMTNSPSSANGATFIVRGSYFYYNQSCGSTDCSSNCSIPKATASAYIAASQYGCLTNTTFESGTKYFNETWVYA